MKGNITEIAHWKEQYPLTVVVNDTSMGNVMIEPECVWYDSGSTVQLFAISKANHVFVKWEGSVSEEEDTISVYMDRSRVINAIFKDKNHLPVAINDSVTICQDGPVSIAVLTNDYDIDDDSLFIGTIDTTESLGYCVIESGDTTIRYTSVLELNGIDHFSYVVSDGRGGLDTADVVIILELMAGISEYEPLPNTFAFHQNFPNPFNPETVIKYQLPVYSQVSLVIYNIKGEKVRTLVEEQKGAGFHSVVWDGRDDFGHEESSGIYFYRMRAGLYRKVNKMMLLK